jgi:integrase
MGKLYDAQFSDGRFVYSTGEKISPGQWDIKHKRPKKGNEDLQERLLDISKQATSFIRLNRASLIKEALKNHLDSLRPKEEKKAPIKEKSSEEEKSLVYLWKEYLKSIEDTVAPRTFKNYRSSFETIGEKRKGINFLSFVKHNKWETISPGQFTITHFTSYLGYLKKGTKKANTVSKRLKHFKAFLIHVQDDLHLPIGFDLDKITYKESPGLKISLSEEELQAYSDAKLPEPLIKVRDLVVIQCNTGLRISDRQRVDKNIKGDKIILETQKTSTRIEIPISPVARAILKKYDYKLPPISEQKYREGIKAIHKQLFPDQTIQVREGNSYKDVFVWEEISSHDMVRTFITLSAERGMSVSSIAKITGKTVAVLLKNYLVESQKVADKEMVKAWGSSPLKIAR